MTIVTNGILMSCCPSCFTLLIPEWCEAWTGTCRSSSQVCAGVYVCRCVCVFLLTLVLSFTGTCVCRCRWAFVCRTQDNSANISVHRVCLHFVWRQDSPICPARIKLRSFCLQGKRLLHRATIPVLSQHFSCCCCFVDLVLWGFFLFVFV